MSKDMILKTMSFEVWQTLTIVGVPRTGTPCFGVNIGPNEEDIALHITPRFGTHQSGKVVYNSFQRGHWAEEVHGSSFPFQYETEFKIIIKFTAAEFQVTLSDGSKIHFPNRLGAGRYSVISFVGDVRIKRVEIN